MRCRPLKIPMRAKPAGGSICWPARLATALATAALMSAAPVAHAATRGYVVTSFDTIRVEAPVRILLATGTGTSASGEGDRALLDRVDLSVSGGVLTVSMADQPDEGFASANPPPPPTIRLSTGQLRRVNLLGGAVLTVASLAGLEADLSLNGNGELIVHKVDVERLSLYVSGGGRLAVDGQARDVRASVNGPGSLEAAALDARTARIGNDGSGTVTISVHGPATVISTGSGDTTVDGKPVCTVTRRGVGEVRCAP